MSWKREITTYPVSWKTSNGSYWNDQDVTGGGELTWKSFSERFQDDIARWYGLYLAEPTQVNLPDSVFQNVYEVRSDVTGKSISVHRYPLIEFSKPKVCLGCECCGEAGC